MSDLAEAVLRGDRRAVARLLTLVENAPLQARPHLSRLHAHTGHAHIVGITGAPGTGKSTLVNQLALELRRRQRTVAVIAVDPSSPFSGGAILGDRIRMQEAAADPGVFIRSMATRGSLGGLTRASADVIRVLDAFGRDVILVETVGVGQDEVDIARSAQTTIVIQTPALGDDIQILKAGILEIADIFVINKADLPGAERIQGALEALVAGAAASTWSTPILQTVANEGKGISALVDSLEQHLAYLKGSNRLAEQEHARAQDEVVALLRDELTERSLSALPAGRWHELIQSVAQRELDPYSAVQQIIGAGTLAA